MSEILRRYKDNRNCSPRAYSAIRDGYVSALTIGTMKEPGKYYTEYVQLWILKTKDSFHLRYIDQTTKRPINLERIGKIFYRNGQRYFPPMYIRDHITEFVQAIQRRHPLSLQEEGLLYGGFIFRTPSTNFNDFLTLGSRFTIYSQLLQGEEHDRHFSNVTRPTTPRAHR